MKKVPLISNGKTPLVWGEHQFGGQYAGYKLGTIVRYKGKYSIKITHIPIVLHAKSLKDAKDKIDKYTNARMKEIEAENKKLKNKKR